MTAPCLADTLKRIAKLGTDLSTMLCIYFRRSVYQYLRTVTMANIRILKNMDWFVKNCEMAKVYGIQFHEVIFLDSRNAIFVGLDKRIATAG